MRRDAMSREDAEAIALAGLGVLAEDPSRIGRFFSLSGLDPSQIRELALTPAFQTAVLTHIRADESLLLTFAANLGIEPAKVAAAETLLASQSKGG